MSARTPIFLGVLRLDSAKGCVALLVSRDILSSFLVSQKGKHDISSQIYNWRNVNWVYNRRREALFILGERQISRQRFHKGAIQPARRSWNQTRWFWQCLIVEREVFSFLLPQYLPTRANQNAVFQVLNKFSLFLQPVRASTSGLKDCVYRFLEGPEKAISCPKFWFE